MSNNPPGGGGQSQVTNLNFGVPIISMERLKLECTSHVTLFRVLKSVPFCVLNVCNALRCTDYLREIDPAIVGVAKGVRRRGLTGLKPPPPEIPR